MQMKIKSKYADYLKILRSDMSKNSTEKLERHVEIHGLEGILEAEFFDLLRLLEDHQLVILIATIGASNSKRNNEFKKWLAGYQCIIRAITPKQATKYCENAGFLNTAYYNALFNSVITNNEIKLSDAIGASVSEIEFGIEYSIDAKSYHNIIPLLKVWMTKERSNIPWLSVCKKLIGRKEAIRSKSSSTEIAKTIEVMIAMAPKNLPIVKKQLHVEAAEFWVKGRKGKQAFENIKTYLNHEKKYSAIGVYLLLRSHLLLNNMDEAIECAEDLINNMVSSEIRHEELQTKFMSVFETSAAEDTLKKVNKALRNKGLKPFLMSGTLLGYLRSGCIMPHDKDVDIGIIGWEGQFDVAQALLELGGFKISYDELKGKNTFLFAPKDYRNQVAIDVFFFHEKDDHFLHGIDFQYGYTQNFKFSKFKLNEIDFLGEKFFIPDEPEVKLTENYGDWKTPIPGYVVSVESPAICNKGGLPHKVSAHLEIIKALTDKKSYEKVRRILNYDRNSGLNLISSNLHYTLELWLSKQELSITRNTHANQVVTT